ncbi:hypothetical protein AcV7_007857 [Taiwanofungus camphoratus]|nr:hypothetical protein AcV7_007857 [Antrodia cinnamomea]
MNPVLRATAARSLLRIHNDVCRAAGPSKFRFSVLGGATRHFAKKFPKKEEPEEPVMTRRPRNHEIEHRIVRLVNPETSQLDPPAELSDIIARLDRHREYVELVSKTPEPIVKIIKTGETFKKMLAQQERKRAQPPREEKEIQITWGTSSGDLLHKLKKVREILEGGHRVNLVYARKSGQGELNSQESAARIQETVDLLADVGKEWKPKIVSRQATVLYFQGHNPPSPPTTSTRTQRKEKKEKERKERKEKNMKLTES